MLYAEISCLDIVNKPEFQFKLDKQCAHTMPLHQSGDWEILRDEIYKDRQSGKSNSLNILTAEAAVRHSSSECRSNTKLL